MSLRSAGCAGGVNSREDSGGRFLQAYAEAEDERTVLEGWNRRFDAGMLIFVVKIAICQRLGRPAIRS